MIRKLLLAFSVLLLAAATAGPAYASSPPAFSSHSANGPLAASQEICAQSGAGYCLNDWSGAGSGGVVKMYNSGYANDNWQEIRLSGYCNNGYVNDSPACPFPNGGGFNSYYYGDPIVEIKSSVSGACIGTDIYADVNLGACPPSSGGTGSNIWVVASVCDCNEYELLSVYWTEQHGNSAAAVLESSGSIGAQAYVLEGGYIADPNPSVWSVP
jgi:hypothetical protein